MATFAPAPLSNLTERQWSDQLFSLSKKSPGLARQLGWTLCYHVHTAKMSPHGFPDWCLVRDRIVHAELKKQPAVSKRDPSKELASTYKLTAYQREWLDGLATAGGEVYVWVPSDLDECARILSKRWRYDAKLHDLWTESEATSWKPGSMWLAGKGRRDGRPV